MDSERIVTHPHRPVTNEHQRLLQRLCALVVLAVAASASAQLRVANWNVAGVKGDPNAIREVIAAIASDDTPGFAAAPHLIVCQEVQAGDVAVLEGLFDGAVAGIDYAVATYTTSPSEDSSGGAMALFYRSDTIVEVPSGHKDLATGGGRKTDRWQMQLVGYTSTAARLYVYGSHLKASTGSANEAERLAGAQTIRNDADQLPAGTHIIFSGDFNLYSNNEPAYAAFLATGQSQAFDPLGTGSWSGNGNAFKHTQSPRDITTDGLIGGGLDDRFDFQLSTAALHDQDGLSMVPGTCRALGNDGAHFNTAINTGNNFYFPGDVAASNALADALFDASDHIPVVCDYQLPAVMSAALAESFGRVIQHSTVFVTALLQNIAAGAAQAVDDLAYQLSGTGVLSGGFVGTAPLAPGVDLVQLPVNTATVGIASGSVVVTSLSQATQNALVLLPISGHVVRSSNGSFSATTDANAITVAARATAGSGPLAMPVLVHNHLFDANQATLDIDSVFGTGDGFSFVTGLTSGIGSTPAELIFSFDASTSAQGSYAKTVSILVSDENIPGSSGAILFLTLEVTVLPAGQPEDLDADGMVGAADLAILLGQWGVFGSADFNGNGVVDAGDLAILLGAWS